MALPLQLNILSLNVWGIPLVSRDRKARMSAIATELSTGKYDVVSLQEVWSRTDCQLLMQQTQAVLPHTHYFYSGVIGAGLLVLSKYPISATLFHSWSVNGYFHRIQHADWFGGKGVGLCRILIGDQVLHLYNAHLHAEYDNANDDYKTHRVIQAFDTAQFIRATRGNSTLQVLAGDLNSRPDDLCYKLLLLVSEMHDCCKKQSVATNCCPQNSYTTARELACNPLGTRIDHIFLRYDAQQNCTSIDSYKLPLAKRVPGQKFSYSDHEAVLVQLRLQATTDAENENAIGDGTKNAPGTTKCIEVLQEAVALCEGSHQKLNRSRLFYYILAGLLAILLIVLVEFTVPNGFKTLYLLGKFVLFGILLFAIFMASIWNFMERNGILAEQKAMEIMLRSLELGLR